MTTLFPNAVLADKVLPAVNVVDQREAQIERKQTAVQTIIISETEVERYGDATVGDVLRRLPGMTATGPAGVTKDIRIRGLEKGYTQFLINGQPIPAAKKDRQIQVDRLPADMIERIEILRSPGAAFDSEGVGGTINIILKNRADNLTRLRVAYGRNGGLEVGDAIVQWSRSFDDLDVLLTLSHTVGAEDIKEYKTAYNADGSIKQQETKERPTEKSETLFAPRLVWRTGSGTLTLEPFISHGTEDKLESATVLKANGTVDKRTQKDEDKSDDVGRLAARYDMKADWGDWFLKAGIQEARETKDARNLEFDGAGVLKKTTDEDETLRERDTYAGAGMSFNASAAHRVSAGVEWRDGDYRNRKTKVENGADKSDVKDRFDIAEQRLIGWVQDEWRIAENHLLTPGVHIERISRRSVDHADTSRSSAETGVNPSLHYLWAFTEDTNLRASVARTVKQPKFDQLNPYTKLDKGVLKGGNPDLRAERALGYELGVEHFLWGNRGIVGANLYRRDVRDYIQKETRVENGIDTERPFNVGRARFYGIEFDWRLPLLRKGAHELNLTGNHSEMRGKVWAGGKRGEVKDMPKRVTNLGLDWYHRPSHVTAGIQVNYQPRYTRKGVNEDGVQETKTRASATLLDFYIGKSFGPQAELRLIAKNLLSVDKDERTVKYNPDGSFNNEERKVEKSSPMAMVTFESRF